MGTWASAACAVHCVLTGLAFGVLSAIGAGFMASREVEIGFGVLAVSFGIWAAVAGFRNHRSWLPPILLTLGLAALAVRFGLHFGLFGNHICLHDHHHSGLVVHQEPNWELLASIVAGTFLIGFHVMNSKLSKRCHCSACVKASS